MMMPALESGTVKGVATLAGATTGNAGIVVGLQGGSAAITDDAGNYVLKNVDPGSYTISAEYSGYVSGSAAVTISAGQVLTAPEMDLAPLVTATTGSIKGVATLNRQMGGNAGITVGVLGGGAALTDDGGTYVLTGLAAGSYTMLAQHSGYVDGMAQVNVSAGQVATAPEIDLAPVQVVAMGGINGNVFLFDGASPIGSVISLSNNGPGATSASDGSYAVMHVPPGTYDVTLSHASYISQTIHSVTVGAASVVRLPDVTLRRASTTVNGHTITRLGQSPDWSLQLFAVDGVLQVVAESTGAGTVVSGGTTASTGIIASDDHHVALGDVASHTLWLGSADGTTPRLITTNWNGVFAFSPDATHLVFNVKGNGNGDYYVVSTAGGVPALVASAVAAATSSPDFGYFLLDTWARTDTNGLSICDRTFLDADAATFSTVSAVYKGYDWQVLAAKPPYAVFTTSTGTNGSTSIGDLYEWKSGSSTPVKLTGVQLASVDTALPFIATLRPDITAWIGASNFDSDGTFADAVIDLRDATLHMLLRHARRSDTAALYGVALHYDPEGPGFRRTLTLDMHNNAGVYTFDLVLTDLNIPSATVIQPNATRLVAGTATKTDDISQYLRNVVGGSSPSDDLHFVFGGNFDGVNNVSDFFLWDGTFTHQLSPGTKVSLDTQFTFTSDFHVAAFDTPTSNATPLTIVNLPVNVAGDGVKVPLADPQPNPGLAYAISLDGSTVAWAQSTGSPATGQLFRVATTPSTVAVTPTLLLTDPRAGNALTWVDLSAKGDVVFTGDQGAGLNAWAVAAPGSPVALDSAGMGNVRPIVWPLADGARTFLSNESNGGGFVAQVDTALTPAITKRSGYVLGSAMLNPSRTRFFYSTSTPTLEWSTSTASGSTPGTWYLSPLSTDPPPWIRDPNILYWQDTNGIGGGVGCLVTAYDGVTGNVPLGLSCIINQQWVDDWRTLLLVDTRYGVNQLIYTPASAPVRQVLGTGCPFPMNTVYPLSDGNKTTLYAFLDVNQQTGNPPSWILNAAVLPSGTPQTLATNLDFNASSAEVSKYGRDTVLFQSVADPTLKTFTLYTSTIGTASSTKVMDNVISFSQSPSRNNIFGRTLTSAQGGIFSAAVGGAGVAIGPNPVSSNVTFSLSGDETHLVAIDPGATTSGNAYSTGFGAAGVEVDDYVSAVFPDFAGGNLLLLASHPTDPGIVIDHAVVP